MVEVETASGERLARRVRTRKGDPDNPLSDEELNEKFHELVAPSIGPGPSAALLAALGRVDRLDDMAGLALPPPVDAAIRASGG